MISTTQFNRANNAASKATTGLAKKLPPPSTPTPAPMTAVKVAALLGLDSDDVRALQAFRTR